jgi:hypothetical protein
VICGFGMKPNTIRVFLAPFFYPSVILIEMLRTIPQALFISINAVLAVISTFLMTEFIRIKPITFFASLRGPIASCKPSAFLAIHLNASYTSGIHAVIRKWFPRLAVGAYVSASKPKPGACVLSPKRFFRLVVRLLALNTPRVASIRMTLAHVESDERKIAGAAKTLFVIEERELYTVHVNLHKRLAAPAGVSAPRGLSMCLNYNTFVAPNQGFSALGGSICL